MTKTHRAVLVVGFLAVTFSVVPALAQQRQEVHFDDWIYAYYIDAMTDSVTGRVAMARGGVVAVTSGGAFVSGRDTSLAYLIFHLCTMDHAMVILSGYLEGPPHPQEPMDTEQEMEVRYRFDQQPPSPWQTWRGTPTSFGESLIHWKLVNLTVALEPGFVDQARRVEKVRFRFRKSQGLPERDLEFSMNGFTRAYAAACENN